MQLHYFAQCIKALHLRCDLGMTLRLALTSRQPRRFYRVGPASGRWDHNRKIGGCRGASLEAPRPCFLAFRRREPLILNKTPSNGCTKTEKKNSDHNILLSAFIQPS